MKIQDEFVRVIYATVKNRALDIAKGSDEKEFFKFWDELFDSVVKEPNENIEPIFRSLSQMYRLQSRFFDLIDVGSDLHPNIMKEISAACRQSKIIINMAVLLKGCSNV